jgi:hypothetical protein
MPLTDGLHSELGRERASIPISSYRKIQPVLSRNEAHRGIRTVCKVRRNERPEPFGYRALALESREFRISLRLCDAEEAG